MTNDPTIPNMGPADTDLRTIEQAFDEYCTFVFPEPLSDEQRAATRKAFIGGASVMMRMIEQAAFAEDTEAYFYAWRMEAQKYARETLAESVNRN